MKTPDIQLNPAPRMRYEVTLTIDGAPGLFDSVGGFAQYKVSNSRCVPLQPISGATLPPEKRIPITFTRAGENLYKGMIYADLLKDEDYYGMGVCHWSLVAASADLKIKTVDFIAAILLDDVVSQKAVVNYFVYGDYLDTNRVRSIIGHRDRAYYLPESRTDIFSVTLAAKEDFQ